MADFPAMPLWTDAYLADTRHLSTLEHGAYLLLMMEAWRRPHCDLPDDDRLLARLAGVSDEQWTEIKPLVMAHWSHDGRRKTWTQKRLSKERDYVAKKSRSQRDKALRRWNSEESEDAVALPDGCPEDAPTPTPTPTPTPISPVGDTPPIFPPPKSKAKVAVDRPDDVPPELWDDFVRHRKAKRAMITATALKGFRREAEKAGWSLADAIRETIERNWQGFKASWIKKDESNGAGRGAGWPAQADRRDGFTRAVHDDVFPGGQPPGRGGKK